MRWISLFLLLFAPLICQEIDDEDQLYLSLNMADGERLELSDGSTYEIAPADRIYSAYWITPFPIMLSESGDPDYPVKIINMNTGTFVRGKQIVTGEVIEKERKKRLEREKQEKTKPKVPEKTPKTKPKTQPKTQTPSNHSQSHSTATSAILKQQQHINL